MYFYLEKKKNPITTYFLIHEPLSNFSVIALKNEVEVFFFQK